MATERTIEIAVRMDDAQLVALRMAANDLKKLAATAPQSFVRVFRAAMKLQRAVDRLDARIPNVRSRA